jgi:hypothetical protein
MKPPDPSPRSHILRSDPGDGDGVFKVDRSLLELMSQILYANKDLDTRQHIMSCKRECNLVYIFPIKLHL